LFFGGVFMTGLQQLDEWFVRLLVGHDGPRLEYSARSYQVRRHGDWKGRLPTARRTSVIDLALSLNQSALDSRCY